MLTVEYIHASIHSLKFPTPSHILKCATHRSYSQNVIPLYTRSVFKISATSSRIRLKNVDIIRLDTFILTVIRSFGY